MADNNKIIGRGASLNCMDYSIISAHDQLYVSGS